MPSKSPDRSQVHKTWLDRLKDWRVRWLSSPRFQKFAADFPLTRPIAKANASASFDLCNGFVYSQILLACVELDLFSLLEEDALTLTAISNSIGLPEDGTDRLLKGAIALKLIESRSQDRFGLGPAGAALLGNPGVFDMIRHHRRFYADLLDPVSLLKQRTKDTQLAQFWTYAASDEPKDSTPLASKAYSDLMSRTQGFIAADILDSYDFKNHGKLLDVAGGDGTFLRAVAARYPDLDLALLDLPQVSEIAKEKFKAANIRADIFSGNMFEGDWPKSCDAISLVRVLHDHDDEPVRAILKKARTALAPGGRLIIAEPMADDARSGDAYFGLYLWAMASGRPRSLNTLKAMLEEAGFCQIQYVKTRQPLLVRLISAS